MRIWNVVYPVKHVSRDYRHNITRHDRQCYSCSVLMIELPTRCDRRRAAVSKIFSWQHIVILYTRSMFVTRAINLGHYSNSWLRHESPLDYFPARFYSQVPSRMAGAREIMA